MWNYYEIYKLLRAYREAKHQTELYHNLSKDLNAYDVMCEMAKLHYAFDDLAFEELIHWADVQKKIYDMLSGAWEEERKYRYELIPTRWWTNR